MEYLIYDGQKSSDLGVYIGGQGTYNAPARDVTSYSIPGRSGDLILDNGRFKNITISYPIVAIGSFATKAANLNAWLMSPTSYCRLEDSYHPDEYRMAIVSGDISYTTAALNKHGKATISFNCKPQRWLKSGEATIEFMEDGTITNPTKFASKPLIRAYGSGAGTLIIGNQVITISAINEYVDLDCELMDCYKGSQNMNSYVKLGSKGFPELPGGDNGIAFSGEITKVEITGRWWTV